MPPHRPYLRSRQKSWFVTPEGLRTIGLLLTTLFGAWATSHKAAEDNRETEQRITTVAKSQYGRGHTLEARVRRLNARVALLERRSLRTFTPSARDDAPVDAEFNGPPAPGQTWGFLRRFVGGIFKPFHHSP